MIFNFRFIIFALIVIWILIFIILIYVMDSTYEKIFHDFMGFILIPVFYSLYFNGIKFLKEASDVLIRIGKYFFILSMMFWLLAFIGSIAFNIYMFDILMNTIVFISMVFAISGIYLSLKYNI